MKLIVGPMGYQSYMRRSMQTVLLYEAKRCILPRISRLRPFQKRVLLMTMTYNILRDIDILTPSEKEAVLWKTQRSQQQLDPVTAWKRCKIIERDLGKLCQQLAQYVEASRTHQQSVNLLVQHLYVSWFGSVLHTTHFLAPRRPFLFSSSDIFFLLIRTEHTQWGRFRSDAARDRHNYPTTTMGIPP